MATFKTSDSETVNAIVMKVRSGFIGSYELIKTGSSARYSHLLIEEEETFTLQTHAKHQPVFWLMLPIMNGCFAKATVQGKLLF